MPLRDSSIPFSTVSSSWKQTLHRLCLWLQSWEDCLVHSDLWWLFRSSRHILSFVFLVFLSLEGNIVCFSIFHLVISWKWNPAGITLYAVTKKAYLYSCTVRQNMGKSETTSHTKISFQEPCRRFYKRKNCIHSYKMDAYSFDFLVGQVQKNNKKRKPRSNNKTLSK